jgi:type II secretory pathway predicted ATPase ExeA
VRRLVAPAAHFRTAQIESSLLSSLSPGRLPAAAAAYPDRRLPRPGAGRRPPRPRPRRLDPTRHTVRYTANPAIGVRGIHHHTVTSLGGRPAHGTATLTAQAYDVLAGEAAETGRVPVLITDEAHLLTHEQLESIRILTNHDMDSKTPFATVLTGQPTLRRMIKLGVLAALDPRIAVRYHMSGGRDNDLYSQDAITQIHHAGRGKPRTVNNICVAALTSAYATGKKIIDHRRGPSCRAHAHHR